MRHVYTSLGTLPTDVLVVVNTTGTPYFQRQPLRDVVHWYGLSEGIRDDYLKRLSGNIRAFSFEGDATRYVEDVLRTFFQDYGDHKLPNGEPARIALYFPQNEDLAELLTVIHRTVVDLGLSPDACLVNTSDESLSSVADQTAFEHLSDGDLTHRVILLVNKGTEGWDCPSLFACALVRKLRTSNNFVLQAATRCLRQVPGNQKPARVYLSTENHGILDRQLQETYGESIHDLDRSGNRLRSARIVLQKLDIPPLCITRERRTRMSHP